MDKIKEVQKKFKKNLETIDQLGKIGSDVGDIVLLTLKGLMSENKEIEGFTPYKNKLNRAIKQVEDIKDHESLKEKYAAIYNQSAVLIVASFESFMNDLVRNIIDYHAEIIDWPDKKQISFDPNILKYSSPTIGSLVIKSSLLEKYTFQDLQSTFRFLKDYFNINLEIDSKLKEKIIEYQAVRNVIVHNLAKVDEKLKKQIRDLACSDNYKVGDGVNLTMNDYSDAKDAFLKLSKITIDKIEEKRTLLNNE